MKQLLIIIGLSVPLHTTFAQIEKAREYFLTGYRMIDGRDYPNAIENFLKAIEIDSTGDCGTGIKGKVHGELGYAYFRSGDNNMAMTYLDQSIKLDPTNPFPQQNKVVILSMQN